MTATTPTAPASKAAPKAVRRAGKTARRTGRRKPRNDLRAALIFIAPASIGFLAFYLWPTIRGFYFSLTDYNVLSTAKFIGLDNYQKMISDDKFWNALKVTVEYVVINIGAQTVLALALGVLMQRLTKSMIARGILLTPYLVANVIVALLWFWLLDYNLGIVNVMLDWIGLDKVPFFGSETWAIPTIAMVNVWRHVGYTALLIFAGLQTIPPQLYEAASVDGSGEVRSFFKITLPLLRPVLAMVLIITITGSFQIYDTVAVTTQGGPVNATRVIMYYITEKAFTLNDFGYASAMSVALFLILAVVAYFQLKLMRAGDSDLA